MTINSLRILRRVGLLGNEETYNNLYGGRMSFKNWWQNLEWREFNIVQAEQFKYLGTVITEFKYQFLFRSQAIEFQISFLSKGIKLRFYRTMISVAFYECGTWFVTLQDKAKFAENEIN